MQIWLTLQAMTIGYFFSSDMAQVNWWLTNVVIVLGIAQSLEIFLNKMPLMAFSRDA